MDDAGDPLASRFAALGFSSTPSKKSSRTSEPPATDHDELLRRFERNFSHSPGARSRASLPEQTPTEHNPEDDLSVQDLVNAVKEEQKTGGWEVLDTDEKTIAELMEEMEALNAQDEPDFQEKEASGGAEKGSPIKSRETDVLDWLRDDTVDPVKDDLDEEDAIIRRIHDELSLEVPTDIHEDVEDGEEEGHEPDDLMARFQSLGVGGGSGGLSLPAVPKSAPGVKPKPTFKVVPDLDVVDETETWCSICNEDAEWKCSGCDNDLYCEECLWESHTGPNAGFEERKHKYTRYVRPKKVLSAAC